MEPAQPKRVPGFLLMKLMSSSPRLASEWSDEKVLMMSMG